MQNGPKSPGQVHQANTIHGIVKMKPSLEEKHKSIRDAQNAKGTGVKVAKTATSEAEALAYRKKVANLKAKGSAAVR